ncbi:MAG TPA: SDR family NAD(P)-dependent oxidoreductase [Candidatus Binatia bacterium]|jgi:NAD(P)-dependent dehydrogenase (short-subunit alcohol dehydrogenase family)
MKNLFSIEGKTALVTGGSRGIGLMIARGYVEAGARVYVASRKQQACDEVAAELNAAGPGTCIAIAGDISTEDGVKALASGLSSREQKLHVLVNNAGTNWGASLEDYSDDAFQKVLATNVKSVFNLTRELLPLLRNAATKEDPARVINIGSIDGIHVPVLETYAYSASKAAVHHLTRSLAKRLASENITVNAVAPGPFQSKMMKETLERFGDMIVAQVPRGRIGEPEDMAGVAIYLASRAGAYVTGAVIPVDGGMATCA